MSKTSKIQLNGDEYTIHRFTIGELERVTEAFQGPAHKVPFILLKIALERAEPKVADPSALEISADELRKANETIVELAGLAVPAANPPAEGG